MPCHVLALPCLAMPWHGMPCRDTAGAFVEPLLVHLLCCCFVHGGSHASLLLACALQDIGAELFGVPGATGFFVSFDPVTGERTERVLKRGEQPPFPFAFW